ncbi:MAG: hypothetical protein JNN10_09390 [Sphingopyxis sp.]|uniref:hypothetical protein n=1 Tax=Sphingopyxis sp. TaxID=1908224 RepID=UPI001A5C6E99|nr:hypothetical protein [Sphingopyxis sp.]MBL9066492.1 hypothetical protein [Sphingopyxis sp.]
MSAAVVKLPTAAPRKVRQPGTREACNAMRSIREEQGAAFPFRFPSLREADEIARALHPMTPERWLLLAMLHVMPQEQFAKLVAFGAVGHPAIRGLMKLAKGSVGLNMDVMTALERLGQ